MMDVKGQMSVIPIWIIPVIFGLTFLLMIFSTFTNVDLTKQECMQDCERIGFELFKSDYSGGGLFGGSSKSCSCLNKDTNDVKVIWGN